MYHLFHNFIFSAQRQAGLFLHNLFLCNLSLTWLKNLHHFSNFHTSVQFNVIWLRQYTIIFGLTWCGIDEMWPHLSGVGGWQKVMSLSCHQSCMWNWLHWWCKHADCGFPSSSALAFGMKMSEKCKSTHLVQCKWKICERNQYWSEIRCNKPT